MYLPPQQVYVKSRLHIHQHFRLMTLLCSDLCIAVKALNDDNKAIICEHADNKGFQVGKVETETISI